MRVQLAQPRVADRQNDELSIVTNANTNLNTLRDSYRVNLKNVSWPWNLAANGEDGEKYNPIYSIATSPLSFVTKDLESIGVHMATVYYTVTIPAT